MLVRHLGLRPYEPTWHAMQIFTKTRIASTEDELWILEHPAVFTLGQAAKREHLLDPHHIPVIQSDRGGQVSYHGPGQLILYVLMDIQRHSLTIRDLVSLLERAVIALLADYQIVAHTKALAPGVYVNHEKICSLGLRIRKGCSYHGLSLNVNMDLLPFKWINPCGNIGLKVVQLSDWIPGITVAEVATPLVDYISRYLESHHGNKKTTCPI